VTNGHTLGRPVRVVLVDDSMICRHQLKEILHAEGQIEVVGEGGRGEEALALLEQHRPDLLVVDLVMPGQGGQETITLVMARHPLPILVLTAQPEGVRQAAVFDAIRRGALDLAEKPKRGDRRAEELLRRSIQTLAQIPVVRHIAGNRAAAIRPGLTSRLDSATKAPEYRKPDDRRPESYPSKAEDGRAIGGDSGPRPADCDQSGTVECAAACGLVVGIGASAGGPTPLAALLGSLSTDFNGAIAVVQHLPVGFTNAFVEYLRGRIALPVVKVEGRQVLRAGVVYLPCDDHHLVVLGPNYIGITASPPVEGHRPSVDVLFDSLARVHGRRSAGVILSGIGQDGVRGLLAMREQGALTLAQSEDTCAVFGMPQAAQNSGAARAMMAPEALAAELQREAAVQVPWGLAK
jgi:two-component system chemotaxis response regulator CheB